MSLIVQKFGGTSVADVEKIKAAARKAIRAQKQGHQVVMVVSAMGKTTDALVQLADEICQRPSAREMDMLLSTGEQVSVALMAMAIDSLGAQGVSLTGSQIGIVTDASHTKARIKSIATRRMRKILEQGKIVIAAGFQGIDDQGNITTLGRGGSDTTAVALAAVLGADACEIYTDVDGVYTTDPRLLAEARRIHQVSYDEMLELASLGAGVMHSRSIEFAKKFSVPIHVRSSFSDQPGTMIVSRPESQTAAVSGAALTRSEARVTIANVPDKPGMSLRLFEPIADRNVTIDMIVQNIGENGKAIISFTVPHHELLATLEAVEEATATMGPVEVTSDDQVSKVSVVGLGMANQVGVADRMFRALAEPQINMHMITTSGIKISALVSREQSTAALAAVHDAFSLDQAPSDAAQPMHGYDSTRPKQDVQDIVARLGGVDMEDLFLSGIKRDDSQARITLGHVPNRPGLAASIFEGVAKAGILVDLIVQSYSDDANANLSFTVPRDQLPDSVKVATQLSEQFGGGPVTSSPEIAILSVSGIGLRSHTGVAIRMFRALADANINVQMISTSEIQVNVVVNGSDAQAGMKELESAFADVLR